MKILVFAYDLIVCGSTVNAIELSAALRDLHGHEVVFFAIPGPMTKIVEEKGLRFFAAPAAKFHPSPARIHAFNDIVQRERPDLIHIWEYDHCIEACHLDNLALHVPMIITDMSMTVRHLLPKTLPTTFGTPELLDQARLLGHEKPELILPPVDVNQNAPGIVDTRPYFKHYGINKGDITIVTVSRLDTLMKAESLIRTIGVVGRLGRDLPLRFLIVGDGDMRVKLERLAEETNTRLGRQAVVLTGLLLDPRPAYAVADIVIGMGSSALRGMAFGKPTIVVGEQGFCAPFTPKTAELFYYKGFYGHGNGSPSNSRLMAHIRKFAEHPDLLPPLGEFSRRFVVRHFSLEIICAHLAEFCRRAVQARPRPEMAGVVDHRSPSIAWNEGHIVDSGSWVQEQRVGG